jgi:RHS repeat-associated protein
MPSPYRIDLNPLSISIFEKRCRYLAVCYPEAAMNWNKCGAILITVLALIVLFGSTASAQSPTITGISPATGPVGTLVTITGTNFGATQALSTISLSGTPAPVVSWSVTTITATVPTGSSTGTFTVTIGSSPASSSTFTVTPLPYGWSDGDIGSVGLSGTASFAYGAFTVQGSGIGTLYSGPDQINFSYLPLSGDGAIVARVVSVSGAPGAQAGVMIRETLGASSANAYAFAYSSSVVTTERLTTGGTNAYQSDGSASTPYWVEVIRSGNTFTENGSIDGVNWVELCTPQTINMAQNVYIGLAVASLDNSALATATFDNVSVSTTSTPGPNILSVSATTGSSGSPISISGSGFGASQGSSEVLLNGAPVPISSWSDTAIGFAVPSTATSGPLTVSVAPSMNDSNSVAFTVTAQPLPSGWLDQDLGAVGMPGNATFSGGSFVVSGAGSGTVYVTSDQAHFVYEPLSGDGSIVAEVVSTSGSGAQVGVMIRETMNPGALGMYAFNYYASDVYTSQRTGTGASSSFQGGSSVSSPYWIRLVRSGNTITAYCGPDGVSWTQVGSSQTVAMAQTVYIGLAVSSNTHASTTTATFANVSVTGPADPGPAVTEVSATTGSVGSTVTISGTGFGGTQGSSTVTLNGLATTINSWSNTSISITIPSGASTGYLVVTVAPSMDNSNPTYFTVTSQPLPTGWLDEDTGEEPTIGSATFSSGVFTDNGAGRGTLYTQPDQVHFIYQPLIGDGSIVARITTLSSGAQAGVMIRQTMDGSDLSASALDYSGTFYMEDRSSYGATPSIVGSASGTLPYWVKLVSSGGTFTGYASPDGSTWTQMGPSQTISMATNVDIGLSVASLSGSSLATATFDNVSITTGAIPNVISLSPNYGGPATSVTVTGTDFGGTQGTSTITFGGIPAASVSSWGNTSIVATVPNTVPAGAQPVVVTTAIAGNATTLFTAFNPIITSINPPSAPVYGLITLIGSGFGASQNVGRPVVMISGTAAEVVSWTDTTIDAQVSYGTALGSGTATVAVDGFTSSGVTFNVINPLTISGISPPAASIGSTVTISGAGFGATQSDSVVTFNGTNATGVVSWSNTSISVSVPVGASTGPVTVEVAGITVTGPSFEVSSITTLTDSLGNTTTYTNVMIGGKWYVSSSSGSGCSTCTLRGNWTFSFDSYGNILSATDGLGHTTSYTYDANSNLTSETQPSVSGGTPTTSYTYNNFGEVLTATDPLGHVTTNTYDANGNLTSVTAPAPGGGASASATNFAYNSLGELTQITDPVGNVTLVSYTIAGLIATITDPQSHVTTYAYDSHGNRTSITDALSHITSFTYDSGDRVTQITYPDSTTETFTYDYRGRRTSVTDQNGKTTNYAFDDEDRLTSVTDAASNVTSYGYDTESNLVSITDANSDTTNFTYDALARLTQTTFPSTHSETYSYDAANNLTSKTDRKGQTIDYVHDALNRLTQKTYPDTTTVDYTYDLVGKVTQVNDPTGTYSFSYDNMGRQTGTSTTYSFLTGTYTNSYSYDAASNRTSYTTPDSSTVTYSYDSANRLTTLASSWAGSFGFSYDALSRRTQLTRPNGINTNYSYNNLSRLLSLLHQSGTSTIDGASYTVDSKGDRTAKSDDYASVTSNYTYDAVYELTQVTQGSTNTETYSYDPVGNRTASLAVSSYTTNSSNEMTANSNASYTYDSNGNTLTKTNSSGTTDYSWDYENRLAGVTLPGSAGTLTFKYDPFGRRIEKISPTTTSIFLFDGNNLVEMTDGTGTEVARYAQGPGIDEHLAMLRGTTTSYYEQDGSGSVTSLTNSAGSIVQSYTYDSFGNTTASSGTLTNFYRYTGREFDVETALYYYRARYYDPAAGRFLSEDPERFAAGVNNYAYVRNRPTSLRDPLGLCPIDDCKTKALEVAAASVVLDAVSAVPGVELLRAAGDAAEAVSEADSLYEGVEFASNMGSLGLTVTEGDGTGAGLAVTGTVITVLKIARDGAGALPGIGAIVAAVSIGWDFIHGAIEYSKCSGE